MKKNYMKNLTKNLITLMVVFSFVLVGTNTASAKVMQTGLTGSAVSRTSINNTVVVGSGTSIASFIHSDLDTDVDVVSHFHTAGSATNITTTSATLTGSTNPGGHNVTAEFINPSGTILSGVAVIPVNYQISLPSLSLTGLTPNTSYTYKLRVSDGISTDVRTISFTTLAGVGVDFHLSGSATNITTTSATLTGSVNPNGANINANFVDPSGNVLPGTAMIPVNYQVDIPSLDLTGLTPNTTYTYKLVISDNHNTLDTKTISFTTLSNGGNGNGGNGGGVYGGGSIVIPVQSGGSCGITSIASNVTKTTATLNGVVSVSNSNTYFEYGKTQSLGLRTPSRNVNSNSSFSENIYGLTPNTTYYFHLVSSCQNGNTVGGLSRLHTPSNVVVSPKGDTTNTTAEVKTDSPIQLVIEDRFETIAKDDNISYTVTYENKGKETLKDSVLQVVVPEGVSMTKTSEGTYSNDNHTLTVFLKDLAKNAKGEIYLDARLESISSGADKLVSNATLVYTNPNGIQGNATASVSNTIKKDNVNNFFGAAAALLGGLLPVSLTGWFVLALIVLVGILIARKYIVRKNTTVFANNSNPVFPE